MNFSVILLLIAALFVSFSTFGQTDSLRLEAEKLKSDTAKVNFFTDYAAKAVESNAQAALIAANWADSLALLSGYMQGEIKAKIKIGWILYRKGDPEKAFDVSKKALILAEKSKNEDAQAEVFTNIAAIYNETGQFERSLEHFKKALEINLKIKNNKGIGRCLNNLAFTASKMKDFITAQEYVLRSIEHNKNIGNDYYLAFAYRTQGDIFLAKEQLLNAENAWKKAYKTAQKIENYSLAVSCLNRLGNASLLNKNSASALNSLHDAEKIALKFGYRSDLRQSYLMLSNAYKLQNDLASALLYHERFFALHDSTFNEESAKKLNQLQSIFETESKEKEILLLKAEQKQTQLEVRQQELQKRWIVFTATGIILTVCIVAYLILRSRNKIRAAFLALEKANMMILEKNEEINQQKEEILQTLQTVEEQRNVIQDQNENILASVRYALRIQQAILPDVRDLKRLFADSFIFYLPKDIVSGDFYWFMQVKNHFVLVVADCTGHGVSGGFMTMIGNNLLNQIVREQGIVSPGEIINLMTPLLEKTLQSGGEKVRDGMDLAILSFEFAQSI